MNPNNQFNFLNQKKKAKHIEQHYNQGGVIDENQISMDELLIEAKSQQPDKNERIEKQETVTPQLKQKETLLSKLLPNEAQFIALIMLVFFIVGITYYAMIPPPPTQWEINTQVYNMRNNAPKLPDGKIFQYGVQYRSDSTAYMVRMLGDRVASIDLDGIKEWLVGNQAEFGYTSHKAGVDVVYATCQVYNADGEHYATLLVPPNTTEPDEVITIWESSYPSGLEIYITGDREYTEPS